MKSLLTRLTENVGDEIASKMNRNILNSLNEDLNLSDFDPDDLQKILKKNPSLWKEVQDTLKKSKPKKASRSSSSSDWSDVGCGRSSRSSCGPSSSSYSDYGCGGGRSSRSGC